MSTIASMIAYFGAEISPFQEGASIVQASLSTISSLVGTTTGLVSKAFLAPGKAIAALGEQVSDLGGMLKGLSGSPMTSFGRSAVLMSSHLETSTVAFGTLLGSVDAAQSSLEKLREFADVTPFNFRGLQEVSKKLLAVGYESDQLIPTLTSVGDAVSAIGGSNAMIDRVVHQFGQMRAQGFLTNRDLKDLATSGLPIYDILADKLGVDVATALDMVRNKAIGAEEGLALLTEGFDEKFGGAMERQSKTLSGLMSTLQDTIEGTLTGIGAKITEALDLREVASGAIEFVKELGAGIESLSPTLLAVVGGTGALASVLQPVLTMVGEMAESVGALGSVLGFILSPMGLVTTALGGIVAAVIYLYKTNERFQSQIDDIWDHAAKVAGVLWEKITGVGGGFESLEEAAESALNWISNWLDKHHADIIQFIDNIPQSIAEAVSFVKNKVIPKIEAAWDTMKEAFNSAWGGIKALITTDTPMLEAATLVGNAIGKAIVAGIIPMFTGIWQQIITEIAKSAPAAVIKAAGLMAENRDFGRAFTSSMQPDFMSPGSGSAPSTAAIVDGVLGAGAGRYSFSPYGIGSGLGLGTAASGSGGLAEISGTIRDTITDAMTDAQLDAYVMEAAKDKAENQLLISEMLRGFVDIGSQPGGDAKDIEDKIGAAFMEAENIKAHDEMMLAQGKEVVDRIDHLIDLEAESLTIEYATRDAAIAGAKSSTFIDPQAIAMMFENLPKNLANEMYLTMRSGMFGSLGPQSGGSLGWFQNMQAMNQASLNFLDFLDATSGPGDALTRSLDNLGAGIGEIDSSMASIVGNSRRHAQVLADATAQVAGAANSFAVGLQAVGAGAMAVGGAMAAWGGMSIMDQQGVISGMGGLQGALNAASSLANQPSYGSNQWNLQAGAMAGQPSYGSNGWNLAAGAMQPGYGSNQWNLAAGARQGSMNVTLVMRDGGRVLADVVNENNRLSGDAGISGWPT